MSIGRRGFLGWLAAIPAGVAVMQDRAYDRLDAQVLERDGLMSADEVAGGFLVPADYVNLCVTGLMTIRQAREELGMPDFSTHELVAL